MSDTNKTKVIIFTSAYPSATFPVNGIFVEDQAECLAAQMDVTVIIPKSGQGRFLSHWLIHTYDISKHNEVKRWRISKAFIPSIFYCLRHAGLPSLCSSLMRHAWMCRSAFETALTKYIKIHGKPDIIHAHNMFPSGWAAAALGKQYNIPVLITEHSSALKNQLDHPLHRQQALKALESGASYLAVSPYMVSVIKASLPEAGVKVFPNVIRTSLFTPLPKEHMPVVRLFCLCNLIESKGVQYLLAAIDIIVQLNIMNFELVIGGDGPYRASLEQQIADNGLNGTCRFAGALTRTQAIQQMQECDIFILPSLGETFGVVLGEAMACGKPVIATRCGGPEYIVTEKTGILVAPRDVTALTDAIIFMLNAYSTFDPEHIRQSVLHRFGEASFLEAVASHYKNIHKPIRDV